MFPLSPTRLFPTLYLSISLSLSPLPPFIKSSINPSTHPYIPRIPSLSPCIHPSLRPSLRPSVHLAYQNTMFLLLSNNDVRYYRSTHRHIRTRTTTGVKTQIFVCVYCQYFVNYLWLWLSHSIFITFGSQCLCIVLLLQRETSFQP